MSLLFMAPAVIFLIFTSVYPLLYSLRLSFFSWNMTVPNSQPVFIGWDNYTRLFSDGNFLSSVRITLIFVAASVTLEFLLGMALALLATSSVKAIGLIRTVLLIPLMMTPVVVGVLWRTLFHTEYGAINFFLNLFGIASQPFVADPKQALPSDRRRNLATIACSRLYFGGWHPIAAG